MKIMNELVKVSVVMCTYNGARFLKEQLDSIINQTYPIYELIIIDDCSSDDTILILETYAKEKSFIKVFQNRKNLGINENFYSAMKLTTGDFIAVSDQDDIWELDKIQTQIQSIGDNLLSSGFSKPFISENHVKIHFDTRIPNCSILRMMYVGVMPGHTMLIHRELLEEVFAMLLKVLVEIYHYRLLL